MPIINTYCPHCWPTKRTQHGLLHLSYYLEKISQPFGYLVARLGKLLRVTDATVASFFEVLSHIGIVRFIDKIDESHYNDRSLIFFREAQRRDIAISAISLLGTHTNEFRFIHNGKKYYYEAIPLTLFETDTDWSDKYQLKQWLVGHGLPVAQGKAFTSVEKALSYGERLGYPLVVKPVRASLSHHCTRSIATADELRNAIVVARIYQPEFLVEQHIEGQLYRATVIGQETVMVCRKERAHVVGDGIHTIQQLIDSRDTKRAKTIVDETLIGNLASIPREDEVVYLQDKFILGLGCDVINVADDMHPTNRELFITVAKLLDTQIVGIDFICPDIRRPYTEQTTAILEANSLPYIDMHQHPSHGPAEPVATIVWDKVLEKLE